MIWFDEGYKYKSSNRRIRIQILYVFWSVYISFIQSVIESFHCAIWQGLQAYVASTWPLWLKIQKQKFDMNLWITSSTPPSRLPSTSISVRRGHVIREKFSEMFQFDSDFESFSANLQNRQQWLYPLRLYPGILYVSNINSSVLSAECLTTMDLTHFFDLFWFVDIICHWCYHWHWHWFDFMGISRSWFHDRTSWFDTFSAFHVCRRKNIIIIIIHTQYSLIL